MQKIHYKCDKEVNPKHWYIIVLKKGKPKVGDRFFKTEKLAKEFLKFNNIKGLGILVMRGTRVIDYELKLYKRRSLDFLLGKPLKSYLYPVDRITRQDMKSFRTKSRRWKREFGKLPTNHTDFKSFRK